MLTNLKRIVLTTAATLFLAFGLLPAVAAQASTKGDIQCGVNAAAGGDCTADTSGAGKSIHDTLATVINILSLVIGIIAVIVVIIGGLKYITSGGDSSKTASAKNTILYAVIGLVIVAFAQLLVQFVINDVNGGAPAEPAGTTGSSSSNGSSSTGTSGAGGLPTPGPTNSNTGNQLQ